MVKLQRPRVVVHRTTRVQPLQVSASTRTRGSAWMAIRAQILARDCGLCQVCNMAGNLTLARDVDHIRELADGGTDDAGNLQAICGPCHKGKTDTAQLQRAGKGKG